MVRAKRARTAERPTQPSLDLRSRAPWFYPDPPPRLAWQRVPDQESLVDVAPTVLDALDLDSPTELQGRSLLPLAEIVDPDRPARPAFITARCRAKRVPHIRKPMVSGGLVSAIRLPGVKLVEYPLPRDRWHSELFDLADDPGETRDLTGDRIDGVAALHRELERWREATSTLGELPPTELAPDVEAALRELGYLNE